MCNPAPSTQHPTPSTLPFWFGVHPRMLALVAMYDCTLALCVRARVTCVFVHCEGCALRCVSVLMPLNPTADAGMDTRHATAALWSAAFFTASATFSEFRPFNCTCDLQNNARCRVLRLAHQDRIPHYFQTWEGDAISALCCSHPRAPPSRFSSYLTFQPILSASSRSGDCGAGAAALP